MKKEKNWYHLSFRKITFQEVYLSDGRATIQPEKNKMKQVAENV